MNKIFKQIILAGTTALALASCQYKSQLDPLEGIYEEPVACAVSSASVASVDKGATTRVFDVTVKGDQDLHLYLVSDKWYINPSLYTPADSTVKNTYLKGQSTIGGKTIKSGNITLSTTSEAYTEGVEYSLSGTVWNSDGVAYKLSGSFTLAFEEDIDPWIISDTQVASATSGVTQHNIKVVDPSGTVMVNLECYRADGEDITGTYAVASYTSADLTMGNGYDLRPYGMDFYGGTYYSLDDNLVFVPEGDSVEITKDASGVYTIVIDGNKFYGKYPATGYCTEGEAKDASGAAAEGITQHTIYVMDGASVLACIVLNRATGADLAGEYAVAEYATADYSAGNGYDFRPYGIEYYGGTYFVVEGEPQFAVAGDIVTVQNMGGAYKATWNGNTVTFSHQVNAQ